MNISALSCLLVLLGVVSLHHAIDATAHERPGVIEIVGYSNRRARAGRAGNLDRSDAFAYAPTRSRTKTQADIETVKQNIEKYNRLLTVDTRTLPESQKDMLEKIVERVARLKESLDIDEELDFGTATSTMPPQSTVAASQYETTRDASAETKGIDMTTDGADDDADDDDDASPPGAGDEQIAARANNNNLSAINGHRVVGAPVTVASKTKNRQNPTRKSTAGGGASKSTTKRTGGTAASSHHHRTSVKPTVAAATHSTVMEQKIVTVTTMQPQIKQKTPPPTTATVAAPVDIAVAIDSGDLAEQKTLPIGHHAGGGGGGGQPILQRAPVGNSAGGASIASDILYDSNVTTSAIIDSLSNHAREDYYNQKQQLSANKDKKPSGSTKPTKYHYYPHNQHIYLLPECAIQQVCNAVYVRLNYTQPLCACPSRYRDPCSASLNEDDQHTTKLIGDGKKKAITLAKTCEATTEMRECRTPKDWSLLALQNTRTGKSHYLVICRCPDRYKMEGPMAHDQPTYASVPGIRVFGMMCVKPGYAIRKPSVQPPKRYQLQKPFYIPNSANKYNTHKDASRPAYLTGGSSISNNNNNGYQQQQQQEVFQSQHQANYQYLNRPDSSPASSHHTEYPESISINTFGGGIYGRTKGETGINAAEEEATAAAAAAATDASTSSDAATVIVTETSPRFDESSTNKRERRSLLDGEDLDVPEFPWDRLHEFQKTIVWED